jgi:hypothetical protein
MHIKENVRIFMSHESSECCLTSWLAVKIDECKKNLNHQLSSDCDVHWNSWFSFSDEQSNLNYAQQSLQWLSESIR